MLQLSENLEERFKQIQKEVFLYDEVFGAPIRRGVTSLVLSETEHEDLELLQKTLDEYMASPKYKDAASRVREPIDLILKNLADMRYHGGSHEIDLRTYPTCVGNLPYFIWTPEYGYKYECRIQQRITGEIYFPSSDTYFGMRITWDKKNMWTDHADAALLVDSNLNFLEGFMYHQWAWFREGRVVHPSDVKIDQPTYHDLDHAIESMASNIEVSADLLKYIIVNSNLTVGQKKSIGFDRRIFTEYKF